MKRKKALEHARIAELLKKRAELSTKVNDLQNQIRKLNLALRRAGAEPEMAVYW